MTRARLVLVHGTRFSHTQWAGYADRLPELEVVTPDLPGHGAAMGEPFNTAAAVAAIGAAVDGAGPGRGQDRTGPGSLPPAGGPAADPVGGGLPVLLAGHSLGGYMAMVYAAAHPRRLAGLVLIGSTAVPVGIGAAGYRGFAALIDLIGQRRMGRLADRVIARVAGSDNLAAMVAGGTSYAATKAAWAAVMADCRPEMLAGVECPVLILGGRYDQLAVHARRFAAACSDARIAIVPGATHLLPITHPDVVSRSIAAFVEEVLPACGD